MPERFKGQAEPFFGKQVFLFLAFFKTIFLLIVDQCSGKQI